MNSFAINIDVRWADLDPNFHVRHSAYYDYAASARIGFLEQNGVTVQFMQQHSFGPVIFREECLFKKEISIHDMVKVDVVLLKATADFYKWTFRHTIYKNEDVISAIITLDGAWIDTVKRKLTIPPAKVYETFGNMPKDINFEWF